MRVLVTGANGRTGRPIVAALANKGLQVRAFVRNAANTEDLTRLGAESVAVGDMSDHPAVLDAALGCDKIIHIGPPMHPQEIELAQNFMDAALHHGIGHFIYYSVMHPLRREVRHHRLKLDVEERLIESGLPYTIVQPSRYMQHLETIWPSLLDQGLHAMPFSVEQQFSVVDLLDLAEAVALIAAQDEHDFASYELAGPETLSQIDMAQTISDILGRRIEARAISIEAMKHAAKSKGLPEDKIQQMAIMNSHYDLHGFRGNSNVLRWLLGREPTRFAQYVQRIAARDA